MRMNSNQQDLTSQKQDYEHQLTEFRKHISQLEIEQNEYKSTIKHYEETVNNMQGQSRGACNDEEVSRENQGLRNEVTKLRQALKDMKEVSAQVETNSEDTEASQINTLKHQLKQQIIRCNDLETQLVDAKMNWAALDLESDELRMKLQHKVQALKMFSSQVTKLEIEMVRAKQ